MGKATNSGMSTLKQHGKTLPVHIIIYPGFKSMEAVGPINVLSYANRHLESRGDPRRYKITLAAPDPGSIPSDTLISLDASCALPSASCSTVMVTGAPDIETALQSQPEIIQWSRETAPKTDRFAALCSGSFFLAASGHLDGRRAATHWSVAGLLQKRFPEVRVEPDAIFVQDDNLWTSAGVSAAIDLTLAFVEQDFGHDLALSVARDLVIYLKRPGGQSQFSAALNSQMTSSSDIRDLQTWVYGNLEKPLTAGVLAKHSGMSVRNFTRLFHKETGMTPAQFVESARCETAVNLLLETSLPLKTIAYEAGFPSDEQMRKVFSRRFSLTPRDYRARFSTSRYAEETIKT